MISYHGTSIRKICKLIKKNGFKPYTFFTPYLDVAIRYGGRYIFAVNIEAKNIDKTFWEYVSEKEIGKDKIIFCIQIPKKIRYKVKQISQIKE